MRLLLATVVLAVEITQAQEPLSVSQLREDFDVLRTTLEATHTGLYRYTPKKTLDAQFTAIASNLSRAMTPIEFRKAIGPSLEAIRCGHTRLGDDPALKDFLAKTPLFPLRLMREDGRYYVLENQSSDHSITPGAEIVSINGQAMPAIERKLSPYFGGDGDITTGKYRQLTRSFAVAYSIVIEPAGLFQIQLRDTAGKRTVRLAGVPAADLQKNAVANPVNAVAREAGRKLDWATANIDLRYLHDPDVAQLRLRGFGGGDFEHTLEKHFANLRERGTKTLIIDVRGNGGGADNLGALLVSYLTDKPFRYFERIRMKTIDPPRQHTSFADTQRERLKAGTQAHREGGFLVLPSLHAQLADQAPRKNAFSGKVFVLIDGGCFSTCADFAAVTHHLKRATFVGEETGGAYYGNNSGAFLTVTLPHSKIPVSIPMWEYWNAVPGYAHVRRGALPDRPVSTRAKDVVAGHDVVLEQALALAK